MDRGCTAHDFTLNTKVNRGKGGVKSRCYMREIPGFAGPRRDVILHALGRNLWGRKKCRIRRRFSISAISKQILEAENYGSRESESRSRTSHFRFSCCCWTTRARWSAGMSSAENCGLAAHSSILSKVLLRQSKSFGRL